MDQMNQSPTQQNPGSSGRTLIWAGVVVIAAVIVYLLLGQKGEAPTEPVDQIGQQDTTTAVQEQLNSIDTGNLDAELKDIDSQLNNL